MAKRRYSRYSRPRMPNVSGIIKRAVSAGRRSVRRVRNYRPKNNMFMWLLLLAGVAAAWWKWDWLKDKLTPKQ